MTSPSPFPPAQQSCSYPYPYPGQAPQPAPPRWRRRLLIGLVALVVVAVCAVAANWWTQDGGSSPLAGRPRVTDTRAGLSYAVPEGWKHDAAKDKHLVDGFSSQMSRTSGAGSSDGATVLAGRAGQTVARADLRRATEEAARSNVEFFFPDRPATLATSQATEVDGQPAHTVVLRISTDDGGTAGLRMTVVTIHGERTSFLLGITMGTPDPSVTADIQAVVADARVG
ncbi:hypothetical protein [Streptomyces sp. NPDC002676]